MQKTKVKLHVDGQQVGGGYRAKKATCTIEVVFNEEGEGADIELEVTPHGLPNVVVRDMLSLAGIAANHSSENVQQRMAPKPPSGQFD